MTGEEILELEKDEEAMNEVIGHWKGGNAKIRKAVQSVKAVQLFRNISSNMKAVMDANVD